MALWGAEGERSRFALPLWRIIYLAEADRGLIVSSEDEGQRVLDPYVVLDLAPGITFNVLDFFAVADTPVIVTTPESTAITNTFSFIKAALFIPQ